MFAEGRRESREQYLVIVTKENIRRYLLLKQLLLPPQSLLGQKGIEKVFNTICSIQFDPQNPCGTNVDLVLQARVRSIHPQDYYYGFINKEEELNVLIRNYASFPSKISLCAKNYFPIIQGKK